MRKRILVIAASCLTFAGAIAGVVPLSKHSDIPMVLKCHKCGERYYSTDYHKCATPRK